MANILILAPARYESSRFPGKPLALINNRPMIHYVVENCRRTGFDYAMVTDDQRIQESVESIQGNIVRVDDAVTTGSARIAIAYDRYFSQKKYDLIINVQGDEPMLKPDFIEEIAKAHLESQFDIYTAVRKREKSESDFTNSDVVKCVWSEVTNQALYFSRSSIPFTKNTDGFWFQHIGVYSYRPECLLRFNKLPSSKLELEENLEQLRALENAMTIGALEIKQKLIGVDRPEDIEKVQGALV